MEKIKCKHCSMFYSKKGIHTHIARSHGTDEEKSKYSSGHNGKYEKLKADGISRQIELETKYKLNPSFCKLCQKELTYKKRNCKYCSYKCSGTETSKGRKLSEETKRKISLGLMGTESPKLKYWGPSSKVYFTKCCISGNIFTTSSAYLKTDPNLDFTIIENKKDYRKLCSFNFSFNSYPEWFDLESINLQLIKYGWYHPVKNPNGCSRDHMVSVMYAWKEKIDPKIISHPANMSIMNNLENISKNSKCSLTLEELNSRIEKFNQIYGGG